MGNLGKDIKNMFNSSIKDMKKTTRKLNKGARKSLKAKYK